MCAMCLLEATTAAGGQTAEPPPTPTAPIEVAAPRPTVVSVPAQPPTNAGRNDETANADLLKQVHNDFRVHANFSADALKASVTISVLSK